MVPFEKGAENQKQKWYHFEIVEKSETKKGTICKMC